jgi:hypothetical protein
MAKRGKHMNERDYVLAKQAGFMEYELEDYTESGNDIRFSRFAELIRADEREEILKLADSLGWVNVDDIRARGNT